MRQAWLYGVVLAGVLAGLVWFWAPAERGAQLAPPPRGGDFTLQGADGSVSLKAFRGKVVLVYFGYTFCPDICPTALAFAAQGVSLLSDEERKRVQLIFISVDPKRDTPERLREYVHYFNPAFIGVTGAEAVLEEVAARYGAAFRVYPAENSATGYLVDHTAALYVVGPRGDLQGALAHGTPPQEIAAAIRESLATGVD